MSETAAYLGRIADTLPTMLAYWDRELRCRFANRAYLRWFGVDPEQLLGTTLPALLGPELFARNEPYVRGVLAGEPQMFERDIPGPDGVARPSLATYLPDVQGGAVVGFVVHVTDVSPLKAVEAELNRTVASLQREVESRKSMEQSLHDSEQSLSHALATVDAGFIASDVHGAVTRMNAVAERLTGLREAEVMGRSLWDVVVREGRPAAYRAQTPIEVMEAAGYGSRFSHHGLLIAADGRRIPAAVHAAITYGADGSPRGMAVVLRDESRVADAELQLAHAQERLSRVISAVPAGILVTDRSGTITLANRAVEQTFGYAPDELVGQAVGVLFPELEALPLEGEHEQAGRKRDGTPLLLELTVTPLPGVEEGELLAAIKDVTERQRIMLELRRSNRDLEQFAYVASHDMQSPLRTVASFTELLAERYRGKLDAEADKYIDFTVSAARRLQRLVADLLAYSRVGSKGMVTAPTSLARVVATVARTLDVAIREAHAELTYTDLPTVLGDEGQLEQLLQNLISNALKFRTPGAKPRVRLAAAYEAAWWTISVADNGIGLDMKLASEIFTMFRRLHDRREYEGSGIGLSIAQRIVEAHGGRMWCESEQGAGTTFFFTLPAATIEARQP